jgi:ABC-type dipeptide/oligopeptide/nickel transport system ATPase subunit
VSALLEVENLRVRFRTVGPVRARLAGIADPFLDAVLDVSFRVRAGTTFGLVGESGSGKSTLGRAVLGLVPVHSGTIRFDGATPAGTSDAAFAGFRRHIALMFQDPVASLSPRLTVKSLITEPFVIHGLGDRDCDAEARRLLDMVNLPASFAGRYPHELSGGQARRIGVARALALTPKLIIADEPTAGLDVSVQGEILNLMARLQREYLTCLVITNLAVVAIKDGDHVYGPLRRARPTAAIFATTHPTRRPVRRQPRPDPDGGAAGGAARRGAELAHRPSGWEFSPARGRRRAAATDARPRLSRRARAAAIPVAAPSTPECGRGEPRRDSEAGRPQTPEPRQDDVAVELDAGTIVSRPIAALASWVRKT